MTTGREPRNERERRAAERSRAQLENNLPSPNVEIIPLNGGRVMIRELDSDGNLIRETWGTIPLSPDEQPDDGG